MSKKSTTDYVSCKVEFTHGGVKMNFEPDKDDDNPLATKSLTKEKYDAVVDKAKKLASNVGGGVDGIPNGQLNNHKRNVSRNRPTKFAFHLPGDTTWRFVKGGFVPTNAAAKARFSATKVSRNGKLVEVTFRPEKKTKNYSYDLWLKAKVLDAGAAGELATVTVIIDPVIRSDTVP